MKKLRDILVLTLALNFLAVAAGVGWLWQDGRLDRQAVLAIRDVLYPPQVEQEVDEKPAPAERPAEPMGRLEELLARHGGGPATEQVQFIQHAFDAQMAVLDRRRRELNDLQRQVDLAQQQMARDRAEIERQRQALQEREQEAARLADDEGFQNSLQIYTTMPPRQARALFMMLDDATIVRYLQAMPPRTAARIVSEFKAPDEVQRIQRVLEMMRVAQAGIEEQTP